MATLTKQEMKVAQLVATGFSDKESADILNCSIRTVVNHKASIFEKLKINKSTELVVWYWFSKMDIKFDLEVLKKQAIVCLFLICTIPMTIDFDCNVIRRRASRSRIRIENIT